MVIRGSRNKLLNCNRGYQWCMYGTFCQILRLKFHHFGHPYTFMVNLWYHLSSHALHLPPQCLSQWDVWRYSKPFETTSWALVGLFGIWSRFDLPIFPLPPSPPEPPCKKRWTHEISLLVKDTDGFFKFLRVTKDSLKFLRVSLGIL